MGCLECKFLGNLFFLLNFEIKRGTIVKNLATQHLP